MKENTREIGWGGKIKTQENKPERPAGKSSRLKNALVTLLVIAVILLIPLFFAIRSQARQTASVNTTPVPGSSVPPTRMVVNPAIATATPTFVLPTAAPGVANGKEPPPCTFPLAQIKTAASAPTNYKFSQPQLILNSGSDLYNIVEWLPDNQRVLVTQDLRSTIAKGNNTPLQQSIELFNPLTKTSKVYAIRYFTDDTPSWLPQSNAVIYPARNFLGIDQNTNQPKFTNQIWVSHGDPSNSQKLADNLPQHSLAVKSDGSGMIYFSDKQIFKQDTSLPAIPSTAFDPTQWDYAAGRRRNIPLSFEQAWQPNTALIFLFSDGVFRFDGYTFILNVDTGKVCELNLGGWAIKARWSLDGRYLAIIRTHDHFPINSSDLAVLDAVTGKVYTVSVASSEEGKHYVDDFVWAPDNYHLLAIGRFLPYMSQSSDEQSRLYLVDFVSGQSDDILPMYTFYADDSRSNLAWSPDGSKLLIRCPTEKDEQVCFISVQRAQQ